MPKYCGLGLFVFGLYLSSLPYHHSERVALGRMGWIGDEVGGCHVNASLEPERMIRYFIDTYTGRLGRKEYRVLCSYTGDVSDAFHLHSHFDTREKAVSWVKNRLVKRRIPIERLKNSICANCGHIEHTVGECIECSCKQSVRGCPHCQQPMSGHHCPGIQKGSFIHRQFDLMET